MSTSEVEVSNRINKFIQFLIILEIVSIFGPYIFGSIRLEQIINYTNLVIVITIYFVRYKKFPKFIMPIYLWVLFIMISLLGFFKTEILQIPNLGRLDSLLNPISVLLFTVAAAGLVGIRRFATLFSWTTITMMAINAVFAIFQGIFFIQNVLLKSFWVSANVEISTAEKAMQHARFSGLFNQPIEAGVAYSLAGLMLVIVGNKRYKFIFPIGVLIAVGGFLTVSKAFIIVGLPVILLYALLTQGLKYFISSLISVTASLATLAVSGWWGFFSIVSLLLGSNAGAITEAWFTDKHIEPNRPKPLSTGSPLDLMLNGRYTGETQQVDVLKEGFGFQTMDPGQTPQGSLVTGIGIFAPERIYDSVWAFAAQFAGLLGIGLIVVILLWPAICSLYSKNKSLIYIGVGVSTILSITSLGAPTLILNRASTISWIFIGVVSLMAKDATKKKRLLKN